MDKTTAAGGVMKIAIEKEVDSAEPCVAATPDTVKKFKALGIDVAIEPGAGIKSGLLSNSECGRSALSLPSWGST
jgi:alanine dehydrogenase